VQLGLMESIYDVRSASASSLYFASLRGIAIQSAVEAGALQISRDHRPPQFEVARKIKNNSLTQGDALGY